MGKETDSGGGRRKVGVIRGALRPTLEGVFEDSPSWKTSPCLRCLLEVPAVLAWGPFAAGGAVGAEQVHQVQLLTLRGP